MPKGTAESYARLWEAEAKKKCRSETAGVLAELMGSYSLAGVDYEGRSEHIQQVIAYLQRSSRLKFRREDIEKVVEFLIQLPKALSGLLDKLVKAGVKLHPDSVILNLRAAALEMGNQSFLARGGSAGARRYLETAQKLAEASTDPSVTAMLPQIRTQLGILAELDQRMGRFGGFLGGGLPFPPPFLDDLDFDDDDLDDEDLDEEGWADEEPEPGPQPAPRRRAKKKRAPRKRR
jgi:hypothetical protein